MKCVKIAPEEQYVCRKDVVKRQSSLGATL